ncbi:P-loop containing nucleoside triphosphate hydrolase protein [Microdochium bolleyi]|uniref:p-loop containing nucleoside triphosphate hydrolase protein n=1 Tax=Microdochium bolleyi TaxID=196109 RepID=A0A136IK11_9PEZI|nr:P-loop containing nucleoside triphosphate hydrolase protein [Microdochium bolleyi]
MVSRVLAGPEDHTSVDNNASIDGVQVATSDVWDFVLPTPIEASPLFAGDPLDVEQLAGNLFHDKIKDNILREYLATSSRKVVAAELNKVVHGFPSIFYAAATNDDLILRTWIENGADVSAIHVPSGTPLLAFAIIHGERSRKDTTAILATLLSLGASPLVIPVDLYTPYMRDLDEDKDSSQTTLSDEPLTAWCSNSARQKLVQNLNLVQRYYLERATKLKQPSIRLRQVAHWRKATPLLGIQYFLIGQTIASNTLLTKLVGYLTLPTHKPLVLVFAGPSGHGKTELARQMGHLLSLPLHVVDCTTFTRTMELFGPRHPYQGAEDGSPLNNFLVKNAGKRSVVFLDEFEKTTKDIHQSLLVPFDNGQYEDRRSGTTIDSSKTIWILATNALDKIITNFCDLPENAPVLSHDESTEKKKLGKKLSKALRQAFLARFAVGLLPHAPVTGRITDFVPFLPFTTGEQAVITRKFLLDLQRLVCQPVVLSFEERHPLLGDIRLKIHHDGAVCRTLAEMEYDAELGSRSLAGAVKIVENQLVTAYLDEEGQIAEAEGLSDYVVDERAGDVFAFKPVEC